MSASMNGFYAAVKFSEELIKTFFPPQIQPEENSQQIDFRPPVYSSELNHDIFLVVCYFSELPTKPYYTPNFFPRGYNHLAFLHYCGKVASEALRDHKYGTSDYVEATNHAILSITSCLTEFMSSGEFERAGGWYELKEMSCKLSQFNVFYTVLSISNIFGHFMKENVENASAELQTGAIVDS